MKSAILLVEGDIRCSRYVDICFSWRSGGGPRISNHCRAPERIGRGQTLPQIWRDGGKKGIFLQRNKAFCCPGSLAAAGTHPFESRAPVSRGARSRQITNLALHKALTPYN